MPANPPASSSSSSSYGVVSAPPLPRWWLWLNLLSLDAPLVAVAWQMLMAWALGVFLRWADVAVLAAAVWLVYAGDRWLDGFQSSLPNTPRHRFYLVHRRGVFRVMVVLAPLGLGLAWQALTLAEWSTGLLLAALVAAYLVAVHGRPELMRASKPLLVALIFGAGCGLLPLLRAAELPPGAMALLVAFVAVCWMNCELVAAWEEELTRGTSAAPRLSWLAGFGAGLGVALGTVAIFGGGRLGWLALTIAAAAWLLVLLAGWRRGGGDFKTVLADAALLVPAVGMLFAKEVLA